MQTSDKKIPSKTYQGFSVHKHRDIYVFFRAESGTRTRDLRITNALLYQLSYFGKCFRLLQSLHRSFENGAKLG